MRWYSGSCGSSVHERDDTTEYDTQQTIQTENSQSKQKVTAFILSVLKIF